VTGPVTTLGDLTASLGTLKDVAGIMGSFVFTDDGRLVAREIPAMFDDVALTEASGRLTRLRDTFAAVGDQMDLAIVRFKDHKLYLKTLPAGMLCIVSEGAVNMPALRMAANLVSRRIGPALENVGALPADPPPEPAAAPRPVPKQMPPGMRRFRGRPVE
jgi:predicted regulator of Ras-like GTPase activity (Roadblock/LC7/MglB family)